MPAAPSERPVRHEARYGRYLEEFTVGERFVHWPGRTVTEGDHQLYCLLTGSLHPVHTDAAVARRDPSFGAPVVVGTYVYALLAGMGGQQLAGAAIANLGVDGLEHCAPLFVGDSLYGDTEVLAVAPSASRGDRGVVTLATRGWNQERVVVCRFTRRLLVWRAGHGPGRPAPPGDPPPAN